MIDPFEDREVAEALSLDVLLDALDDLDVSRLSDDQLARLAQIVDALAVEIDQEAMERDDPPED